MWLSEHDHGKYAVSSRSAAVIGLAFAQVEPAAGVRQHTGLIIRLSLGPMDRTRVDDLCAAAPLGSPGFQPRLFGQACPHRGDDREVSPSVTATAPTSWPSAALAGHDNALPLAARQPTGNLGCIRTRVKRYSVSQPPRSCGHGKRDTVTRTIEFNTTAALQLGQPGWRVMWFTETVRLRRWQGLGILTLSATVVIALKRPEPAMRVLARLLPVDVLCYVDTEAPAFALTFDDGPHPDVTPLLLDVLARHRARATFFMIGERVLGNESTVARIAGEGHELANHLMRDEPSVLLPDLEFRQQLSRVTSLLAPYGAIRWFRPGSGWLTPRMLRSAAQLNLRCVLGTVVAVHSRNSSDRRIAQHLIGRIRPGSIAVLHEGTPDRRGVVSTTDLVLAELRSRGLAAVTISELAALRR